MGSFSPVVGGRVAVTFARALPGIGPAPPEAIFKNPELNPRFSRVISTMMAADPDMRYENPAELMQDLMLLAGEPNIREVIAFPKTQQAADLMAGAPSEADDEQLADLHIAVTERESQ